MRLIRALGRIRLPIPRLALPSFDGERVRTAARASLPLGVAACAVLVAVAASTFLTTLIAERSYAGDRNARASAQANSYAEHSGLLATGDAFGGYIQILRDAEDPEVALATVPSDVRTAALRRLLELNTNRFSGLAVVDLNGVVVAATGVDVLDAPASQAYTTVRANRGNANSDIVLPEGGGAYVDYATILIDPVFGPWGVLIARAEPSQLWQSTLAASIDGGQNVIINRNGQLAAGITPEVIGTTWSASEFGSDAYRSTVAGVDSVCGLAPIARDTQIDHDWNVASCLPASVVLASGTASNSTALLSGLVALALVVVATVALLFVARRSPPDGIVADDGAGEKDVALVEVEPEEQAASVAPPIQPTFAIPDEVAEARTIIEAFEERNARIAGQLRESVQARLLVASSRVEEGLTLLEDDAQLATVMLERAAHELDDLNEHELRALGQELHPDLVRLGLPAALRALRKDIAAVIEVDVTVDSEADSLDEASGRAIDMPRRIVLHRVASETLRLFADAGLEDCTLELERTSSRLWLGLKGHGSPEGFDADRLAACAVAIQAYGGNQTVNVAEDTVEVAVEFEIAGGVEGVSDTNDLNEPAEVQETTDGESEAA